MPPGPRHVVLATDERFVVPTAAALRSLSLHEVDPISVWILASGVDGQARARVESSIHGDALALNWIDATTTDVGDTTRSHIGRATYLRLAVGDLLPASVEKALYLDGDVLVQDTLAPLWDVDLDGAVALAVRSVNYPFICTYGAMDHWPALELDPRAPYFNAGVMLIDLHAWRRTDVGGEALRHLASPLANGRLADQEALNAVLAGRWKELPPRWNQQTPLLHRNRGAEALYPEPVLAEARQRPAVVHFLDRPKPWQQGCAHPAAEEWRRVAAETAFGPVALERTPRLEHIRWRVKRAASALIKGV